MGWGGEIKFSSKRNQTLPLNVSGLMSTSVLHLLSRSDSPSPGSAPKIEAALWQAGEAAALRQPAHCAEHIARDSTWLFCPWAVVLVSPEHNGPTSIHCSIIILLKLLA